MKTMRKRLLSLLLCVALLAAWIPVAAQAAPAESNRVADPSTMDSWKELFLNTGSTENAGAVWTDKSVFTDESAFPGVTRKDADGFLVALSAMAANMTVSGASNVPTDTMMILDLSSSMYNGSNRNPTTVKTMLTAVNQSIDRLQKLNRNNRVGVVVYFGGQDRNQSKADNSMVLLPLDRYSGTTTFLKANVTSNRLISVAVNSGVKNSAGQTMPQTKRTVTDVAGTYAQLGILDAMDQLLAADTTVPATADYQPGADRVPVFIFMSDGEPTAATPEFTQKVDAGMGNNTVSIRNPNETDFVTQLTAAYAKTMVDAHYEKTTPLFYSLSLGTSVSLAVMDPKNHTTSTIDGYWDDLMDDGKASITVYNSYNGWSAPTVKKTYTVSKTASGFPADKSYRDYTDKAFTATTAGNLTDAFSNIVDQISIVSKYTPTLTTDDADLSGYISFVDKIGRYMTVTDIKGILIDNTLYSGADLAKNFVAGGGDLGTYDAPTSLGDEMVWAVQARLGIDSVDTARTLIGLAYEHGQLSYTSPTEYSNYIGWYANAAGQFLGFWHEGIETMPEPTGNIATDPAFIIKSYGYLGKVDESQGVAASDMMYATVQVRKSIATGEESVAFAVPAALIPIVTYNVTLDLNGNVTKMTTTGAEHPIRLVYEVALDENINEFTLTEQVDAAYLAANTDENGAVSFYTNQYEADNTTGYGKVNTYSYFNPSRENQRYYYLENSPVYTDTNGTRYTGTTQPEGTFYRAYTVYTATEKQTHYRRLSDAALATAVKDDAGWHIPAGNVHVNLEGYTVTKTANPTDTLTDAYIPFVDAHNHSVGDLGYNFIVGATLGNNGKLSLIPATGMKLTKTMEQGIAAPEEGFTFTITGDAEGTLPALLTDAQGKQTETTVTFAGGTATVELKAGQSLYISGMAPGSYTVTEHPTLTYLPETDTATVTVTQGKLTPVTFVNGLRGKGDLTISKKVIHSLGSDYAIPLERTFAMDVTLTGLGAENATFEAIHTGGRVTSVTTDAEGNFSVTLAHDEQIQILGLPEGITATVRENTPGAGFTAAYWESGETGDGVVTIGDGTAVSVTVANTYTPQGVKPTNVKLRGSKKLVTEAADWSGAEFTFHLQKFDGTAWHTIASATVNQQNPAFDFDAALANETFTAPGTYTYQVLEEHGGETIDGITYDATLHTFGITVTDADMDGALEIGKVVSFHSGREFDVENGDWSIDILFTNTYQATGCTAVIDVQKALVNKSNSPLVSLSGYRFGLYENGVLFAQSELTDAAGEARLLMNYTLADEGIHTYTLKEIVPDAPIPGMTYDTREYAVTVTVTDNHDGTTSATVSGLEEIPVFTNVYEPQQARLPIDFVTKHLLGRPLVSGEFTFAVMRDGERILTGTNSADGKVTFEHDLYFDKVGTYRYTIAETGTDGNGVTLDKAVYNLIVTVTDQGGTLQASHQIMNVAEDTVVFINTYTPADTTATISGTKKLTGRMLLNDEFIFRLTDESGQILEEVRNFADGTFAFTPIPYDTPGTYRYEVYELDQSAADFGITYDTRVYHVTVTVTDDLKGALVADVTIDGGEIVFENVYTPQPTSAKIPGEKALEGKVLNAGDFRFMLYESDPNWTLGKKLETVTNDEQGAFTFSELHYDTAGSRYYLVKEEHGGATIDGVYYDPTIYHVEVTVIDNLRGNLISAVHIYDEYGVEQEGIVFRNRYTVTGTVEVEIQGRKLLEGRELVDGEFTFALYEGSEEPILRATNQNGKFTFHLEYTAQQAGNTFRYTLAEEPGNAPGVTYDETVYTIEVQITDDGKGNLQAIVTSDSIDGDLTFTNTYTDNPKTGDESMVIWYAVLLLSCGGVLTLLLRRKKEF